MKGKLRFILIAGIVGFVFTFVLSIRNNLWMTSMYRALLAFVIWALLAFLLNWVIATMIGSRDAGSDDIERQQSDNRGNMLDLSTPDEDRELMDLIQSESSRKESGDFVPLNPPKLVSTKDPEELAKAVRHLTEE